MAIHRVCIPYTRYRYGATIFVSVCCKYSIAVKLSLKLADISTNIGFIPYNGIGMKWSITPSIAIGSKLKGI